MARLIKLNDVADIKLGLPFKKAINDAEEKGLCYLIQAKDIMPENMIRFDELPRVIPETNHIQHILKEDDILLRMRGPYFSAAIIDRNMNLPIIATNQIAVIRCNKKYIEPYYLHWFINSKSGQNLLNQFSEGSNIIKVNLKVVSNIEWMLPKIEQQKNIVDIQKNWLAQKNVYKQLIELNSILFNELCSKLHSGELNEH